MTRAIGHYTALAFLGLIVALVLILTAVPPVSRDALSHHLFVPRLYLEHGGMYEIADIPFSYFPMNLDLLYLIPLAMGNDILAKYIHFAFGLLTAWLIYAYIRPRLGKLYGLWGALLFLTVPIIIKLSMTVYVDLGLVFFSTASLLGLFTWSEKGFKGPYLVLAAISCGLALGTKYNGLICLFLLSMLVPLLYLKPGSKSKIRQVKALGWGIGFVGIALVVFSPWMIRNYIWTQNPVYPLGKMVLGGEMDQSQGASVAMKPMVLRRQVYGEKWWQTVLVPLRIFFQGKDDDPRYFDGRLSPLLLFLPLGLILPFSAPEPVQHQLKLMLLYVALFVICAFFMVDMRIRYIAPVIAPLTILSIFGLHAVVQFAKQPTTGMQGYILKIILVAAFLFWAVTSGGYFLKQFRTVTPFEYLGGKISRGEYIQRHRPEYAALDYANCNLKGNIKILGLFLGDRGYYSHHKIFFDTSLFWRAVKRAQTPEDIVRTLKKQGVTHLCLWQPVFVRWSSHNFDANQRLILKRFLNTHLQLLFSKSGYSLYQLTLTQGKSDV